MVIDFRTLGSASEIVLTGSEKLWKVVKKSKTSLTGTGSTISIAMGSSNGIVLF